MDVGQQTRSSFLSAYIDQYRGDNPQSVYWQTVSVGVNEGTILLVVVLNGTGGVHSQCPGNHPFRPYSSIQVWDSRFFSLIFTVLSYRMNIECCNLNLNLNFPMASDLCSVSCLLSMCGS